MARGGAPSSEEKRGPGASGPGMPVVHLLAPRLAYSSGIAGAMLQRRQAAAIEDAIRTLESSGVLRGREPRGRAGTVRSLLVVPASDRGARPVVQATRLFIARLAAASQP